MQACCLEDRELRKHKSLSDCEILRRRREINRDNRRRSAGPGMLRPESVTFSGGMPLAPLSAVRGAIDASNDTEFFRLGSFDSIGVRRDAGTALVEATGAASMES